MLFRSLDLAFSHLDLDWQDYVVIDPRFYRPAEVDYLKGDPSRAREVLGWEPKTDIKTLAGMMVKNDLELARREQHMTTVEQLEAGQG